MTENALVAMDIEPADDSAVAEPPVHPLALVAVDVPPPEDCSSVDSTTSNKRPLDEGDDDGASCPICLDEWTTSGPHRVCALKCGHLFGDQCITRWLAGQKKKTCPTCKKTVRKDDLRYIYAKKLVAVDTTELESVKKQLEVVTEERNMFQQNLTSCLSRELLLNYQIKELKSQVEKLAKWGNPGNSVQEQRAVRLYMEKCLDICQFGGSRVFDARTDLDLLVASMKCPTNLFNGFGIKKINISDYRTICFTPVHNLQIRDITFHPENNWVLTASMDKTFKVINNHENTVVHKFTHQMPLWSCCWDSNNPLSLYIGTQSGNVLKYDLRSLTEPTQTYTVEGDMSPVVSVASVPSYPGDCLPQGGVISCKLNSLWVYENNTHARHAISLEGPFVSMKYQFSTRQILVSSRPNGRVSYARHSLCTFDKKSQDKIDVNIIHTFQGGGMQKLLSKSCFVKNDQEDYVAAYQENCKAVVLWSVGTGNRVTSITAHENVLDLKGMENKNGDFLGSLTDKKLVFFKFN